MKKAISLILSCLILGLHVEYAEAYFPSEFSSAIGAGMHKAGYDLAPGIYRLYPFEGIGQVLITSDANQQDIIEYTNFMGISCVEVQESQFITLENALAVPVEDIEPFEIKDNTLTDGTYLVGFDIPAGEYKIFQKTNDQLTMYTILDDLDKRNSVFVSNSFENSAYLDVKEGQYLFLLNSEIKSDIFEDWKPEYESVYDIVNYY